MTKSKEMQIEMIPCPVCGKPMPKKRMELGYNYCVNCSTEGKKVCMVKGNQEGDGNQEEVIIMTAQEAQKLTKYRNEGARLEQLEEESSLDMRTFEEREAAEETLHLRDVAELEGEFGYEISDRTAQGLENYKEPSDEDDLTPVLEDPELTTDITDEEE